MGGEGERGGWEVEEGVRWGRSRWKLPGKQVEGREGRREGEKRMGGDARRGWVR